MAVGAGIMGLWVSSVAETGEQRAWLVFGRGCIKSVNVTEKTELRFPMVDGKPDKKNGKLSGVEVDFVDACGKYEVVRDGK